MMEKFVPDEITEKEVKERAIKILRRYGWRAGDSVSMASVIQLMVRLGMDIAKEPLTDYCNYPDCGCDFDEVCETGRLRLVDLGRNR